MPHLLINLCHYVRIWGGHWVILVIRFRKFKWAYHQHDPFFKRKLAEQLLFCIDACQTIGNIADKLLEKEDDDSLSYICITLNFLFSWTKKNHGTYLIFPRIYSIGKLNSIRLETWRSFRAVQNLYLRSLD